MNAKLKLPKLALIISLLVGCSTQVLQSERPTSVYDSPDMSLDTHVDMVNRAKKGDGEAARLLASELLRHNQGEEAFGWLRLGARNGNGDSQTMYGRSIIAGAQIVEECRIGAYWINKAASVGNSMATSTLLEMAMEENIQPVNPLIKWRDCFTGIGAPAPMSREKALVEIKRK